MKNSAEIPLPAHVRDRDIVIDSEGRVFVVLGHIQPSDRILAFLKYVPSRDGRWISNGVRYERVFWGGARSASDANRLLPPEYLVHDSHFGAELLEIPRDAIARYFSPEKRLAGILHDGPQDILEERAEMLCGSVHDTLDIPYDRLGVAGSVLWQAHSLTFSDLNLNVYGLESSWVLENGYEDLVRNHIRLHLRDGQDWERATARLLSLSAELSREDVSALLSRRRVLCAATSCTGFTPVLLPEETPIRHSSEAYQTISPDPILVRLRVNDARYGVFQPSVVGCTSPVLRETGRAPVTRLLIYEGLFRGLLREGDSVEVRGTLQRVTSRLGDREPFYQLMVGTKSGAGREYLRVLSADQERM